MSLQPEVIPDITLPDVVPRQFVPKPEAFMRGMKKLPATLKMLGYASLRPGQDTAVFNLFHCRDTFAVIPTAHGKTAISVVPAVCMDWKCLIFSPLVALMQDQVTSLQRLGLSAGAVSSGQTQAENMMTLKAWEMGELQFLLVAPERLENSEFLRVIKLVRPNLVTVDEAHCHEGYVRVATSEGKMRIKDLHDLRVAGKPLPKVLSMSAEGHCEFKNITNSWQMPFKALTSIYTDSGMLRSTSDHLWWTQTGWKRADSIIPGVDTLVGVNHGTRSVTTPNADQLQLLIGSFFGDGGFGRASKHKTHYRCKYTHGIQQADYCRWKTHLLGGYCERIEQNGYAQTPALIGRSKMFKLPWALNKSDLDAALLSTFDSKALAVWIMDDGSLAGSVNNPHTLVLHTEDFPEHSVLRLSDMLKSKYGVSGRVRREKEKYWTLCFKQADALVLLRAASPYFHVSMFKKLKWTLGGQHVWSGLLQTDVHKVLKVQASVRPHRHKNPHLYDIEVEDNHNLFVHSSHGGNTSMPHGTAFLTHNCLSNWSDSFRPSYVKIGNLISAVNPDAVLAMTATCTKEIDKDVRSVLGIVGAAKVLYLPSRKELVLKSENYKSDRQVLKYVEESTGATIVYCATRKRCEELFNNLGNAITGGSLVYHGGMPSDARTSNQNLFMSGDVRVMFATNAFGMGIDKRDIRMILHRDVPASIEAYSQETGRAARDGLPSQCVALVDPQSFSTNQYLLECSHPERRDVERVYHTLVKHADKDRKIMKTGADLASMIGVKEQQVSASLGVLKSSGVIDREDDETKPVTIRFVKPPDDAKFVKLLDDVKKYGMLLPDGSVDLSIDLLLKQTGRKYATVHSHLKKLDKDGFIVYTLPFRGKTTVMKGDLSLVDFERLAQRKRDAYAKLDAMQDLLNTPDEQKHEFLTNYFSHA